MGKRKAKGSAEEDSCVEELIGAASGAAGSNAAAGSGVSSQRSRRRRNRDATTHEAGVEGITAGEPNAPGAGGAPALARESLARFMVPRVDMMLMLMVMMMWMLMLMWMAMLMWMLMYMLMVMWMLM